MSGRDRAFWEERAEQWLERFCVDGIDPWGTDFNLPAFLDLISDSDGTGLVVDVGCGDGRVARMLTQRGHHVVGFEPVAALASAARAQGSCVAIADGAQLPLRDDSALLAVSSMVLMDIDDLDAHLSEFARLLAVGGSLCIAILHPIRTAGDIGADGKFEVEDYLSNTLWEQQTERNGGAVTLRWWRRSMSTYLNALVAAGFDIADVREPIPTDEFIAQRSSGEAFQRVPMFLHLRATRR